MAFIDAQDAHTIRVNEHGLIADIVDQLAADTQLSRWNLQLSFAGVKCSDWSSLESLDIAESAQFIATATADPEEDVVTVVVKPDGQELVKFQDDTRLPLPWGIAPGQTVEGIVSREDCDDNELPQPLLSGSGSIRTRFGLLPSSEVMFPTEAREWIEREACLLAASQHCAAHRHHAKQRFLVALLAVPTLYLLPWFVMNRMISAPLPPVSPCHLLTPLLYKTPSSMTTHTAGRAAEASA